MSNPIRKIFILINKNIEIYILSRDIKENRINNNAQCFTLLQFKKQGKLCRAVQSDCDVPEYCTGDSRDVSIFKDMLS